jgi:acyl dehydratase
MSVPMSLIGTDLAPVTVYVDAGRLRFFAEATGQTDPVYTDLDAARAAGHPQLPVPPTFLFGLEFESADGLSWLTGLGVDLGQLLHGEQTFSYRSIAHAGDTLVLRARIVDVYTKKAGALEFIRKHTSVTRTDGSAVAELDNVLVVRHPVGVNG